MTSANSEVGPFVADATCVASPGSSLREVASAIATSDQTLCLIVDDGDVAGVLSEGDIVRALHDGADLDQVWAADVMTTNLVTISARSSIRDAIESMLSAHTHQVLVLDDDIVPGLLSLTDTVEALTRSREWAR